MTVTFDEMKVLEKAATKGPWEFVELEVDENYGFSGDKAYRVFIDPRYEDSDFSDDFIGNDSYYNSAPGKIADAKFVSAARSWVPNAIAELKAKNERIAKLENTIAHLANVIKIMQDPEHPDHWYYV